MGERYVQINKLRNMCVNCRRTDSLGILMRQIYRRSSFNHVKIYNIVRACNEWVFHLMHVEKKQVVITFFDYLQAEKLLHHEFQSSERSKAELTEVNCSQLPKQVR